MNKNEVWKDVAGYEGYYQVSNEGRVRSVDRYVNSRNGKRLSKGKLLRPKQNVDGYLCLTLSKKNQISLVRVNRLVAEAFIDNPDELPVVNHIDRNKINNNADNLKWCTVEYNARYSSAKAIAQYDKQGNLIREWEAISDAHRELGINLSNIAQCCRGFRATAGGYVWRHAGGDSNQ